MSALKGTQAGRDLMANVRAHKTTTKASEPAKKPVAAKRQPRGKKYDDIIAAAAARLER